MKKLFVHHPIFRLLSPFFSGTLVYLLLLLINNNISQLQENFLGQELYVCIGLAFVIQEFSRFSLLFFKDLKAGKSFIFKIILQLLLTVASVLMLVSGSIYAYFKWVLLYTPNTTELYVFNVLFGCIAVIYITLYLSHHFLYKINTAKIAEEMNAKDEIEDDFLQFKSGINPKLLYESLEAMIVLMKRDKEGAEMLSNHFASVYRYILTQKQRELVKLDEELQVLEELVLLFNHLPYRKIDFINQINTIQWVLPSSMLLLVELIIKSSIVSLDEELTITLEESSTHLCLSYVPQEKLTEQLTYRSVVPIAKSYQVYSDEQVTITNHGAKRSLCLPKLNFYEDSNH